MPLEGRTKEDIFKELYCSKKILGYDDILLAFLAGVARMSANSARTIFYFRMLFLLKLYGEHSDFSNHLDFPVQNFVEQNLDQL